ncbi:MAG TPA: cupin domain-containing protein [Polyangiales bacterium]|nr:cupin domain-containing protein [Polyangiales bacterium]
MPNYATFEAGNPDTWSQWKFKHPLLERSARGKLFLRELLGLTGMEVSLNTLPPSAAMPFLHTHREHEELYVFLSGSGEFQVDGERFPVTPGALVRVAPAGERSWRNTGDEPLVYIVIQAKQGTVTCDTIADGVPVPSKAPW